MRIHGVRVAILDVGSNTVRLLVADAGRGGRLEPVVRDRAYIGLGGEIARTGSISPESIRSTARVCAGYAERARSLGAELAEAFVTAPGRQGDAAGALVAALRASTQLRVRVLSSEEEGRLAFEGAVARAPCDGYDGLVGVVDVGGGSTEIAVGTPALGAGWVGSVDLGSLRLTRLALADDPPSKRELAAARELVRRELGALVPPRPGAVLAVGGSARAVARLVGRTFDADDLDEAVAIVARRPSAKTARRYGIDARRAGTVLAGALLLGGAARALGRPLTLARGGLREGAVLALVREAEAAAA
jgi:exopolyphosphatase / guanosine-5'-triphosphate,3'-diphosphate pyrophosphatase